MTLTRRELGKLMLTVPAAGLLSRDTVAAMLADKPNSKWAGVQVGLNVPYNYGARTMPVDEVIAKTVQLNVNAVELRSQPIELFMGAPMEVLEPGRDREKQKAAAEQLRDWRGKKKTNGAAPARQKITHPGIPTHLEKVDRDFKFPDPGIG